MSSLFDSGSVVLACDGDEALWVGIGGDLVFEILVIDVEISTSRFLLKVRGLDVRC